MCEAKPENIMPEAAPASDLVISEPTPEDAAHLCRLCLNHDKYVVEIFQDEAAAKNADETAKNAGEIGLPERLYDLFQIKYEKSPSLPHVICQRCLYMVRAFYEFREKVKKCETDLQVKLEELKARPPAAKVRYQEYKKPGLNGCEGEFQPEENSEITEVDPNMEYESSDDDFSMESDSENEVPHINNVSNTSAAAQVVNHNSDNSALQAISPSNANHNMSGSSSNDGVSSAGTKPVAALESHTTTMNEDFGMEFTVKNTFLCQYCDMAFTTHQDCLEHENRHDASEPYLCNFCSQHYNNRQTLICHIKEVHDAMRPYVCAMCNKGFGRRSDLKKHTIVHTGVRPFSCPVCGKSFSRNTNLTKHMRIHSSIKPHVCQHCPRSFSTATERMRHARSHSETKPFQCNRCPASFTRKDKLQLHVQGHYRRDSEFLQNQGKPAGTAAPQNTDYGVQNHQHSMENMVVPLNPYSAEGETHEAANTHFAQTRSAKPLTAPLSAAHKAFSKPSHSRNYTCQICFQTFTRERDLQRHQALHLDTLFTCKQCGTGFSRREKLARHEAEAHGPQYNCDYCHNTFHKRDEYELHMKIHELQQKSAQSGMPPAASAPMDLEQGKSDIRAAPPPLTNSSEMSFYSQMVPTMNLGFYSETRPEE